jgi:hypothetical protein
MMKNEFLQTIFKGVLIIARKAYEILYALFMSVIRIKLFIRVFALLLAVILWHDNQKKFEKSQAYYKLAVQSGLESGDKDIKAAAAKLLEQIDRDQMKRARRESRATRGQDREIRGNEVP